MKLIKKTLLLLACVSASASFAAYPDKQITMIVPYAPAGSTDVLGRILAQVL